MTAFNKNDKRAFLERLKTFSSMGESIYRAKDLKTRCDEVRNIIEIAEQLTLQETENWFDDVTVNKHMKTLKESYKIFEKTTNEIITSQQRLESSYEDIANILERYYDIG